MVSAGVKRVKTPHNRGDAPRCVHTRGEMRNFSVDASGQRTPSSLPQANFACGQGHITSHPKEEVVKIRKKFKIRKLEERIAPAITQVNGGGHEPNGQANGIPSSNPAGQQPPGQNK
jgi:hypothetical protein